ncbi:hypothetical protein [Geodermatophilus sp. DSM 44513]|uniref:hypothetical protein n=1 Tax=Geodermatophilus sp. DSM 44513 TaxID=1528104 RepID=UPI0028F6D2D4|nr:hypothetical protein [Geodermatophilus sp. DSM 44513]WNV77808.1 hypothetical protein RTG05_11160 [Geodermatophilus sp. DSM 44513]
MSTESLRAVRELEHEIGQRLAAARSSRAVVDRATAEARQLAEAATVEARELARRRVAALVEDAGRRAAELRAAGTRRAQRLRAEAAARLDADVEDLLAVVAPTRPPAWARGTREG